MDEGHRQPTLVIRADATSEIGAGHVMRCLALAQAWQDEGGRAVFLMARGAPGIEQKVRAENMEARSLKSAVAALSDATETASVAHALGACWIVLDGYGFDQDYRYNLITRYPNVLWIDDLGTAGDCYAKMVLNSEINASDTMYLRRAPSTQLLLGPQYLLLRREFHKATRRTGGVPELARNVLVTMGGADSDNITSRVLTYVAAIGSELDVTVVVGPANPHRRELEQQIESLPLNVQIAVNPDLPSLMSATDLAVSAGGGTCWELAFMGVPLVLVAVADNQEPTVREFGRRGLGLDAGGAGDLDAKRLTDLVRSAVHDPSLRRNMSERARHLIDGRGAARVVDSLRRCPNATADAP